MYRPLALLIGSRYVRAKRRNQFISFISLVSTLGLMLGVMVLIIVLSVMNGFDQELKRRILGVVPHILVTANQPIEDWQTTALSFQNKSQVEAIAPLTQTEAMISFAGNLRGVSVSGIEASAESNVSIIDENMLDGRLSNLVAGEFNIVLGDLIARFLGINIGDRVTLILPDTVVTPAGVFPRLKRFKVVGIFQVGAELDAQLALININDAGKLLRMGQSVEGIRIKLDDIFAAPIVSQQLQQSLPNQFNIKDWTQTQGSLFEAVQLEKTLIALLLFLVVLVAAFNIVSTLIMMVTDKRADIAILRTLGASPMMITCVFIIQGSLIGFIGTIIGALLGILIASNITDIVSLIERAMGFQFFNADVYFISYLPSDLQFTDVSLVVFSTLLISFLATLYPSYRAALIQPAEALRYD